MADYAGSSNEKGHSADVEPHSSTDPAAMSNADKISAITRACQHEDIDELVQLADSAGGLLNDSLRRDAWPILLGCHQDASWLVKENASSWKSLPRHRDEDQVQLDVNRSFVYYPKNESEASINGRKRALSDLIVQTLREHPMLCYFQGYHDIAQVLLLVLQPDRAAPALARVSLLRIRDYMLPKLSPVLKQLQLLPAIVQAADTELATHLSKIPPHYALSATLTLFAHDIEDSRAIARLFDFLLAHEPVMCIYLLASTIVTRRAELLEVAADDPEMLLFRLSKLTQPLDLEKSILHARHTLQSHPPERLQGAIWWRLSSSSVLKTSRSLKSRQSLRDGERLFQHQARQMKREETMQRALLFVSQTKGPILTIATAVLIGAFSIWLRRSGQDKVIWTQLLKAIELIRFRS